MHVMIVDEADEAHAVSAAATALAAIPCFFRRGDREAIPSAADGAGAGIIHPRQLEPEDARRIGDRDGPSIVDELVEITHRLASRNGMSSNIL
ncbi:hypothetical protein [Shinella sp. M31]|uniref:hypothetical protein n=1 Tax=Shinella sp. M31 TaxID=3368615 RepID=UPI003B9DDA75